MATKIEHIQDAYSQLRISGLTVQPSPADLDLALTRFENMMAELQDGRNLCLGYNFEESPDPATESGLDRYAYHFAATNLAVRLAPDFNKVIPQTLLAQASQSYSTVSAVIAAKNIRQVQAPSTMPVGSGNSRYNNYYRYNTPSDQAVNNCDTKKLHTGDINDYLESFAAYLDGETLSLFTLTASSGLTAVSSSISGDSVIYRIQADTVGYQTVVIVATTSSGRIEQRTIEFEVS